MSDDHKKRTDRLLAAINPPPLIVTPEMEATLQADTDATIAALKKDGGIGFVPPSIRTANEKAAQALADKVQALFVTNLDRILHDLNIGSVCTRICVQDDGELTMDFPFD